MNLKTAKAWALFRASQLDKSKKINDAVKSRRAHRDNLLLDFNITEASGQWERFGEVLEHVWRKRGEFDARELMRFAHVAGLRDQHDLALKFAKQAVRRAPKNPHILAAGFFSLLPVGARGGREP